MKALCFVIVFLACTHALCSDEKFYLKERGDPVVEKAFEKARQNIGIFLAALEDRASGKSRYSNYAVYLKFSEGDIVEYLWLDDVQKYEGYLIGVIISEPQLLSNRKSGATIGFHSSDIFDWQLADRIMGETLGGFLICSTSDKEYLENSRFTCKL